MAVPRRLTDVQRKHNQQQAQSKYRTLLRARRKALHLCRECGKPIIPYMCGGLPTYRHVCPQCHKPTWDRLAVFNDEKHTRSDQVVAQWYPTTQDRRWNGTYSRVLTWALLNKGY